MTAGEPGHGTGFGAAPEGAGRLADDEARVLLVDLDQDPAPWSGLLAQDERARAARFHFDRHRRRWTVAHGALRRILGDELGAPPAELEFATGEQGKPALPGHPGLHFNLSHSAGRALVAITRLAPVGVDIEERRPIEHEATIARRYFSPAEIAAFDALPADQRHAAFYRCWTRKEAYLKATGEGLSLPLAGFDVTLGPDEPARLLRVGTRRGEEIGWSLHDLSPPGDFAGALVLATTRAHVHAWAWHARASAPGEAGGAR